MKTVHGKYFGEIEFTGDVKKTTFMNGKVIHDILLSEPITHFGDSRIQILVNDEDLQISDSFLRSTLE